MSFYPEQIDKNSTLEKFAYHEFLWNTGAGQIGQIKNIITDFLVGGALLKLLGLERYLWLIPIIGVLYIITVYILGYILQKKNLVLRRGSINNKLSNPQLMELLNK